MNEWTLAGEIVSYINSFLERNPDLPFTRARLEKRVIGKKTRHDVFLDDKRGRSALTGELKVPDAPDGAHPYVRTVVLDAQRKADAAGSGYFFTWNANTFVLWRTFVPGTPIHQRDFERFDVVSIETSEELDNEQVQTRIREFLERFLPQFAEILEGRAPVSTKPLDERFIEILEDALRRPIRLALVAVRNNYVGDTKFRNQLNTWMREQQQWIVTKEAEEENLSNAAKLSSYVLMTTVIFYEALRRRFPKLQKLPMRASAAEFLQRLQDRLDSAILFTNDYQTVLTLDFGSRLPLKSDEAAAEWLALIGQIEDYDFTQIDYEIIGSIFEKLISPKERHKYGQHYTMSELVDVLNAYAIRTADDVLFDPTCGGGTFLVRGYLRKRSLAERADSRKSHQELLSEIYGIELADFPAHLATINLAVRDLIDADNYPRVRHQDFFDAAPHKPIMAIPTRDGIQQISLPAVDALIANFPYVRQEQITPKQKQEYLAKCANAWPSLRYRISKRADVHIYMWPHAASFLKGTGRIAILTSSGWLDTGYGVFLQKFLLDHFSIAALLESECEPWFTGARVITVATLAQMEADAKKRDSNLVRFVSLRKPLRELLDQLDGSSLIAAEKLLAMLVQGQDEDSEQWRIRIVRQEDLRTEGESTEQGTEPIDDEETDNDEDQNNAEESED